MGNNYKKRLLIIHPSLGLGGAEKIISFLCEGLGNDFDVELLLLKSGLSTLNCNCKIVIRECYDENPILGRSKIKGIQKFGQIVQNISSEIKEYAPYLVVCFDLRVLVATFLATKGKRTKLVFSERTNPYDNARRWDRILRFIYKHIECVVFQTEEARLFYGTDVPQNVAVIPNPAIRRNQVIREQTKYHSPTPYIFSAGRCQYRKGFDLLIDAFFIIQKKYQELSLVIFGDGDELPNLKKKCKELAIMDKVVFEKPHNDIIPYNCDAKLFILSSRSEGIPNILIEAILEGIPTVAADCSPGGARLVSNNGEFCLLCENNNSISMANSIEMALNNYKETIDRATMARSEIPKLFNPEEILDLWIYILNKI